MSDDVVIEVEGLTKSFRGGPQVVKDLAISVRRGRIYGFLGPNGSGKTTTIRMLCGLLRPDSGRGTCLGFDILRESEQIKKHVGYMTQRFSLYGDLTVHENLAFVARVYDIKGSEKAISRIQEKLGLQPMQDHVAATLSGGWKQRLALAACMLHEPELLLLDEPTAGVDPKARRDFWAEIHELADSGITILVSTHYMDEAERCHELAFMFNGRLLSQGPADVIMKHSGLTSWVVTAADLPALDDELADRDGVDIVTPLGDSLRVSGRDATRLDAAIEPFRRRSPALWRRTAPTLEDVFIELMNQNADKRTD
jgi:ABC-2 type transport system ATP-binding protein